MKTQAWKVYAFWILLAEAVGALAGWLTRDGVRIFTETIEQPPLSPPPIVFPIVWAILYALMGIGAARVSRTELSRERSCGLRLFGLQLGMNFLWSLLFFNAQAFGFAFLWLILLWAAILWMGLVFYKSDPAAAWLQLPYLLWVSFALYLNFGVWRLNG